MKDYTGLEYTQVTNYQGIVSTYEHSVHYTTPLTFNEGP